MNMLDPVKHERLIQDIDYLTDRAAIAKTYLSRSAVEFCTPVELDWLVNYPMYTQAGVPGLRIYGPRAIDRCMAMTAALLRNFIDARVRTVDQMIDAPVECTVLLCPNFLLMGSGKNMPSWRVQKLYDALLLRRKQDQPTVLWIESDVGLTEYGAPMVDLLSSFKVSKAQ